MKNFIILSAFLLTGCYSNTEDLQQHIEDVQASTTSTIEPMPKVKVFGHFDYSANVLRSPFDVPKPEAIQEKIQQMSGCLTPEPRRKKQPLEKFSLSDLVMRGTLGELGVNWALLEASNNTLHRVAVGGYVGLYHGRITAVSQDHVKVLELIPDGAGCWVERETVVTMTQASVEGQGK